MSTPLHEGILEPSYLLLSLNADPAPFISHPLGESNHRLQTPWRGETSHCPLGNETLYLTEKGPYTRARENGRSGYIA